MGFNWFPGVKKINCTKFHSKGWKPHSGLGLHVCTVCMHIFKLCACVHTEVWVCFPVFELACAVASLLHSHSRASVKLLELMMPLKCHSAGSPVERAVMPGPSVACSTFLLPLLICVHEKNFVEGLLQCPKKRLLHNWGIKARLNVGEVQLRHTLWVHVDVHVT